MGVSERESQALGSIQDGLAGSDPALASMLGIFSRLTSGEEMSAREKIQVRRRAVHSPRRARRRPHHGTALRRAHQLYLRLTKTGPAATAQQPTSPCPRPDRDTGRLHMRHRVRMPWLLIPSPSRPRSIEPNEAAHWTN